MSSIRFCQEHMFFEGEACPNCSTTGIHILSNEKRRTVSSFLSGLLRHFPDDYDLTLSDKGWVDVDSVSEIVQEKYNISEAQLLAIISLDEKGRYELSNDSVRAAYGHSISYIETASVPDEIPKLLFHGTAPQFKESILENGLQPQSRNSVHLTSERSDAITVGQRHSNTDEVILFKVDTQRLHNDGYTVKTTNDEVYTVSVVPSEYITETIEI